MRILVGAGSDAPAWAPQGWVCNDTEDAAKIYAGITLVGPCWSLPVEDGVADEIMAKGMVEHLTYAEVVCSLIEWRRVLKVGGHITVEVPDVDEYIRAYVQITMDPSSFRGEGLDAGAEGEPDDREACIGPDRWLRRALYGWQRWPGDEHRSGWTEALLAHYLRRGFSEKFDIRRATHSYDHDEPGWSRVRHLWARAWKTETPPVGMDLAWKPESAR